MCLGNKIKKVREENNLSQRELGRLINKTGQFISLIEQGESNPSLETLKEIANVLGISPSKLMESDSINNAIGSKLKDLRIQNKLSQKELSQLTDISEISIRKYEKNERNPKIEALKKIAAALNVPLSDFIEENSSENTVGDNIKKYRKERNLKQKDLATKLNLTVRSIQNYEGNQREPSINTLKRIALILDVNIEDLMGIKLKEKTTKTKTLSDYTTQELLEELLRREKEKE